MYLCYIVVYDNYCNVILCVCMSLIISGEPLDVMKRALLCTSTQELASKIVPRMKHIDYAEDK